MYLINLNLDQSRLNRYLSNTLLEHISQQLIKKQKIILYINKRWAFQSTICSDCSHLFGCPQCDSSLTLHHSPTQLHCHLCGYQQWVPQTCPQCKSNKIQHVWVGIQQIQESLNQYFPQADVFRFDSDSMKNKSDKVSAIDDLKQADIIIGTKMITTGFDFKNIGLIWVILIEGELKNPRYNTHEQVYNNISQLLWRGSRLGETTQYIIQTYIPNNPLIQHITQDNYKTYFRYTLEERKLFWYPPFQQMLILEYRNMNEKKSKDFIDKLYKKLCDDDMKNIELVRNPNIFKKHNQYFSSMIIKWPDVRARLGAIKSDIFQNSWLTVQFQ